MSFVEVGLFLKEKRVAAGLTQRQVSDHLGYESPQFVSNWERGECLPPPQKLKKLIKLLHIPADEIIQMIITEKSRAFQRDMKVKLKL